MFKKLNTTTLIIILIVLGAIVLFNKFYKSKKEESTFNTEFVKIDTSSVKQILIYPKTEKGKEIKITKNGAHWDLQNDKVKTVADSNAVRSLLAQFADIKAVSLAGQDKSSWNDLQVADTSGSRIKFISNDNHTYDMVVGKFGYNPSARNGLTYIRHADEEAVYAIDGFLSFTVNQRIDAWRNKTFITGNKDNWTTLTFTYPSDSSFQLSKENNKWMVNGQPADSEKTAQYLNQLANMQNSGFAEGYTPTSTPIFTLNISGNNQSPITVQAYPADSAQKYILNSSQNPDAYFSEAKSNLVGQVFKSRGEFVKE